jgi:hypothetical protein
VNEDRRTQGERRPFGHNLRYHLSDLLGEVSKTTKLNQSQQLMSSQEMNHILPKYKSETVTTYTTLLSPSTHHCLTCVPNYITSFES